MKYAYYICLLAIGLLATSEVAAQCADPDASIWNDTWHSCVTAESPNPHRGEGHWIQYDFGNIYTLTTTHIWNTNEAGKLDEGFQEVIVDYSLDGEEWLTLDTVQFEQGTGLATYGGFTGFDFAGDSARYVLLTALSNYGHPTCYGLAEVKFNLKLNMEGESGEDDDDDDDDPGEECFRPVVTTAFVLNSEEVFIIWEYVPAAESYGFRYRESDGGTWIEVPVDEGEPEVFLEGLDPGTTYEYQIATYCEEQEFGFGSPFYFTTTEELEECAAPTSSNWFFAEDEGYLLVSCNEVPDATGYTLLYRLSGSGGAWTEIPSEENFWEFEDFDGEQIYEYQIRVDCEGGETALSDVFSLHGQEPVGTRDIVADAEMRLFPNPTNGVTNLSLRSPAAGRIQIQIRNLMGQNVLQESHQVSAGALGLVLPTQNLRAGVYTVNVYQEGIGQLGVHKLVVAK